MKKIGKIISMLMVYAVVMISTITSYAYTDVEVPGDIEGYAEYYAGMYGLDTNLILAIIFAESSYQPEVEVGSCVGLMQINTEAHPDIPKNKAVTDIKDPQQNICCGCMVLYELFEEDDDPISVLIKYNGDRTGLVKYRQTGEASDYATKVMNLKNKLDDNKSYR